MCEEWGETQPRIASYSWKLLIREISEICAKELYKNKLDKMSELSRNDLGSCR